MLGDFGLTMSTKQELAVSPVGTVEYMAPEVSFLSYGQQFSLSVMSCNPLFCFSQGSS